MDVKQEIIKQARLLYPTGRAWKMPVDGDLFKLTTALAESQEQAYNDAISILRSLLPDNPYFTADDATDWERRLGIASSSSTTLADRKAAIKQKLQAPGRNPAKGHYLYIQQQIQLAGFTNVYIHENLFSLYPAAGYESRSPITVYTPYTSYFVDSQHGDGQHGDMQSKYFNNMVVNSISQAIDNQFGIGNTFRFTFFIGGQTLGTWANVPSSRKTELRQLILKLKPAHTIGFLFINYT